MRQRRRAVGAHVSEISPASSRARSTIISSTGGDAVGERSSGRPDEQKPATAPPRAAAAGASQSAERVMPSSRPRNGSSSRARRTPTGGRGTCRGRAHARRSENSRMPRCAWHCITVSMVRSVGVERRAVVVVVEEVGVEVERVDRVELGDVDEIDAHRPRPLDADRPLEDRRRGWC